MRDRTGFYLLHPPTPPTPSGWRQAHPRLQLGDQRLRQGIGVEFGPGGARGHGAGLAAAGGGVLQLPAAAAGRQLAAGAPPAPLAEWGYVGLGLGE